MEIAVNTPLETVPTAQSPVFLMPADNFIRECFQYRKLALPVLRSATVKTRLRTTNKHTSIRISTVRRGKDSGTHCHGLLAQGTEARVFSIQFGGVFYSSTNYVLCMYYKKY